MANEKRLVWTDDVMAFLCKRCNEMYSDEPCEPSDCLMIEELEKCPTVDAAPVVHGRWVEGQKNWYVCSVCYANAGLYGGGIGQNLSHYCQHCGAKMDGGDEDG